MAEQEKNESFFRKVVRFVANPATDWADLTSRQEDTKELELEKSELKAMIERKRRNDFVRKREFDMLRKVRREGLSPEQLAALGTSSRLDDSESRSTEAAAPRPDGVKAKIDEIEQQMVGEGGFSSNSRRGPLDAPSRANAFAPPSPAPYAAPHAAPYAPPQPSQAPRAPAGDFRTPAPAPLAREPERPLRPESPNQLPDIHLPPATAPAPVQMVSGLPPLAPLSTVSFDTPPTPRQTRERLEREALAPPPPPRAEPAAGAQAMAPLPTPSSEFGSPFAVEVSEVMHDPDLDEAVIAFANADFGQCEEALQRLTGPTGARSQHAETWLVLFDLYRATGQQQRFESLALDYAQQFGWSAPQWYSLPKLVADKLNDEPVVPRSTGGHSIMGGGDVGWVCPEVLDIEAVARLRSQTLQMPLPWVFDWSALRIIDPEAAMQLSTIFRLWSGQQLEMRWQAGDRLFQVLAESAPTGVRDADPAFWLTRLDALRLANRADQFDEAAIDYCVTYEVSPPSWEPTRCTVHIAGGGMSTRNPPMSMISDVSTSFYESGLADDAAAGVEVAHVELSGQLIGDISATLGKLQGEVGLAPVVSVSCARLIRVDFIAAGDLLNWVLARRGESRAVQFVDAHRLLALFFGAMGINEHAKVQVRKV